mmetsp:Transcript_23978/g.24223  ORF Transcript_23978/g.24223 Transcript_23978/m.24223 type:complete len:309 (+) Transcript_23978:49-975(+)
MRTAVIACLSVCAVAFSPSARRQPMQMNVEGPSLKKIVATAVAGIFTVGGFNMPAQALTKADVNSLSYLQVKGTGLANRCPEVIGEGSIPLQGGKKYAIKDLCIEPKSWQVEEEVATKKGEAVKEFVNTKLMTRQTYSLDGVSGSLEVQGGNAVFTEEDGIDYAATTVQLPGGARVPFLFTVKDLVAKSSSAGPIKPGFDLGGSFTVPSYRTGLFLDPKGRGTTTGYDFTQGLIGIQTGLEGDKELFKENNKKFDVLKGDIEFAVNKVNAEEGEFGGVFVSTQPSDTDMGAKEPKKILIKGIFYGQIE